MGCNRSHSCRSFGCSLLAFAAAFMAGSLAVQTASFVGLFSPAATVGKQSVALPERLTFGPCSDSDPISIRRRSLPLEGGVDSNPVMYLLNRTDEPLRLSLDHLGNLADVAAENDSHYSPGIWEKTLSPSETFIFSAEKYDRGPVVISLSYRTGNSKTPHRFAAYFSDSSQTPYGCGFN